MNVHAAVNLNAWISGDFTGGVLRISDYIKILWHDHLKSLFLFSSKLLKLFARRVFFLIQRWWYRGRGGFFALHLLFSTPEIWKRWWYRRENKSFRLKTTKKDDVWDGYEISSKLLTLFANRDIFSAFLLLLFLILVWSWWWYRGQTDLLTQKEKNIRMFTMEMIKWWWWWWWWGWLWRWQLTTRGWGVYSKGSSKSSSSASPSTSTAENNY